MSTREIRMDDRKSEDKVSERVGAWEWIGGRALLIPMMEVYHIHRILMICDLHYGDRRSD